MMRQSRSSLFAVAVIGSLLIVLTVPVSARAAEELKAHLTGYQEVPPNATPASGEFRAKISTDEQSFDYELTYSGFPTDVLFAHIHFGQQGVNGAISTFLCSNSGGPAGTSLCPLTAGMVTGTVTAATIIGPAGQGINPGEFAKLLDAIRAGVTYVNVHTMAHPGGEIRGQTKP